jgi:hypothetical protein
MPCISKNMHVLATKSFYLVRMHAWKHERIERGRRERRVITLWVGCKDPEEQCHGQHGGYTLLPCHSLPVCYLSWLYANTSLQQAAKRARPSSSLLCGKIAELALFPCWNNRWTQAPYIDAEDWREEADRQGEVRSNPHLKFFAPSCSQH